MVVSSATMVAERFLEDLIGENATTWDVAMEDGSASRISSGDSDHGAFDARVFWGVNIFIALLVIGMCVWCCYFGGKDALLLTDRRRVQADMHYQRTIQRRHDERMAARRSTPAKREARLKRSFERNRVQMVVKKGDIIEGDDTQRYDDGSVGIPNANTEITKQCTSSSTTGKNEVVISNVEALEEGTLGSPVDTPARDEDPPVLAENEPEPTPVAVEEEIEDEEAPTGKEDDSVGENTENPDTTTNFAPAPAEIAAVAMEEGLPNNSTGGDEVQQDDGKDGEQPSNFEQTATCTAVLENAAVTMEGGLSGNNNTNNEEPPKEEDDEQPTNFAVCTAVQALAENMSTCSVSEHPTGYLVLRPGNARRPPPPPYQRTVSNCCAVCLGAYEVGDKVVWSCNSECSHAFHLDCIMDWLMKIQDGSTPCPCCRQEFTSWEVDRQERKIKWAAGSTFNTGALRF